MGKRRQLAGRYKCCISRLYKFLLTHEDFRTLKDCGIWFLLTYTLSVEILEFLIEIYNMIELKSEALTPGRELGKLH